MNVKGLASEEGNLLRNNYLVRLGLSGPCAAVLLLLCTKGYMASNTY